MPKEMTVEEHVQQLMEKVKEAAFSEAAVDEATNDLMLFLAAPDWKSGYIVTVEFLGEEAMTSYHKDLIRHAELAAGWDPTP